MKCNGCGNEHATFIKIRTHFDNDFGSKKNVQVYEVCDKCGGVVTKGNPDVWFREPYWDENLGDAKNPNGQWVTSKAHKAQIMAQQGVREAGDRKHGSRVDYRH